MSSSLFSNYSSSEQMTSTIDSNEYMTSSKEVNWLDLPDDLTLHIMGKLATLSDYVRFGAVCLSWQLLFLYDDSSKLPPSLPLLMVLTPTTTTETVEEDKKKKKKKRKITKTKLCSLYNISDKRIYDQLQIRMPLNGRCRGFSNGWLVIVDDDDLFFPVQLLNPFSGKHKLLPPLTTFPCSKHDMVCKYSYLQKAVLSANPTTNPKDCIVMAIYGHKDRLAFWKPGDKAWTPIAFRFRHIEDVIYYKGRFTAINCLGEILTWDETDCKMRKKIIAYPPSTDLSAKKYIVELLGSLYLVHRSIDYHNDDDNDDIYDDYFTSGFKVFKLASDPSRKGKFRWVEVRNLHDHMLFLGDNASMSISAASGFTGCKPNSIYYTDDYVMGYSYKPGSGPHDLGVFDLKNQSFDIHYPADVKTPIWTPPIWVETTLHRSNKRFVPSILTSIKGN